MVQPCTSAFQFSPRSLSEIAQHLISIAYRVRRSRRPSYLKCSCLIRLPCLPLGLVSSTASPQHQHCGPSTVLNSLNMFNAFSLILLPLLGVTALTGSYNTVNAKFASRAKLHKTQIEAAARLQAVFPQRAATSTGVKNITFSNPRASEFYVDGTSIPDVDWDIGPSWSGLLPISSDPDETRKLFFWFFPPGPQGSPDDLIFWTNGGPGCSSMMGLLQENGPFQWAFGQAHPTQNEHSWTNISNLLFVEQPVGTGFSQGTPNITNEDELAEQFVGFLGQFLDVFQELQGKTFYATGESYAGMYVPYIANYIYEHPTAVNLSLNGIWIADPLIGNFVDQQQIPAVDFVHNYEAVFALNQTFLKHLDEVADRCGYAGYVDKHVTFPPKGPLPLPGNSTDGDEGCDVWDEIYAAALLVNPGFNIYRIYDMYPYLWDVLGFSAATFQKQSPVYFDREEVKRAIHAPVNVSWFACSEIDVFVGEDGGDDSPPSAFAALPNVIEKSKRAVLVHGLADFVLIAEGARIVIQNMTWNGQQGFQTPIEEENFIVDGQGSLGNVHTERGFTYVEVALSGHEVPQFSPRAAFQTMEYLVGFRETP
ncbi:alpha/beta-hydrolase [Trametes elegans]|nr:alpha/beta-hydrolase [Trametes elegans]